MHAAIDCVCVRVCLCVCASLLHTHPPTPLPPPALQAPPGGYSRKDIELDRAALHLLRCEGQLGEGRRRKAGAGGAGGGGSSAGHRTYADGTLHRGAGPKGCP